MSSAGPQPLDPPLTREPYAIAGQFQLIVDHQKIRGLQSAVHQVPAVKEGQGIQSGRQQVAHFVRGEGAVGKNLCKTLFGMLHDYE